MDRNFGGIIWTNHAMDRMRERGIKQGDAWATWNRPEQSRKNSSGSLNGAWVYYRTWGNERIEVVAKKDENGKWIVLSVWSRPVLTGDRKVEPGDSQKTSFWRRFYNFLFPLK